MLALLFTPVVLSLLLLGAHFLRDGSVVPLAIALASLGLLAVRRAWAAWALQGLLLIGALEWIRTLVDLVELRRAAGQPSTRMVLILSGVALFTAVSALLLRSARARKWFKQDCRDKVP